jgi:prepilin-type N-terminal cleavage/methylation domain-containing protein
MRIRIHPGRKADGFSLVEIIAVIAIILCIAAFAIPNFMTGVANIRLRSGMSSLSGLIQNCRMQAIKQNRNMSVHFTIMSAGPSVFIKDATGGSTLDSKDPQIQMGAPMSLVRTPSGPGIPTLLDSTSLGFDPSTEDLSFNPRGLPCLYASGTCTTPKGFVYYFTDTRPYGSSGWTAVSVSPAGHVKTWMWYGSAWGN